MPRSPRLLGCALVAALSLLAGCGGDPADPPGPSPSPSATSPSTPVVPTLPPEAQQDTRAGAIAFVKHYIELLNYAQATGDVDDVNALTSAACSDCRAITERLAALYADGGRIVGGALTPEKIAAQKNLAEHGWSLLVRVSSDRQVVYEARDATPKAMPGGRRSMSFFVVREESGWRVQQWARA